MGPSPTEPRRREAARVLLVAADGSALLLLHADPLNGPHWATPGGGLEPGETFEDAAMRELAEESGRTDVRLGPLIWEWTHRSYYGPHLVDQYERIYLSRTDKKGLGVGLEAAHNTDGIVAHRWWTAADLRRCEQDVWPPELPDLLQRLT